NLAGVANGPHTETLKATDVAGNFSTTSVAFTLDTQAPSITITSPVNNAITNQASVTGLVTDALSGVASLQVSLDGGAFAAVAPGGGGSFTVSLAGVSDGHHSETFKATDQAGNVA